jgi:hypothetical protein
MKIETTVSADGLLAANADAFVETGWTGDQDSETLAWSSVALETDRERIVIPRNSKIRITIEIPDQFVERSVR